MEKKTLTAAEFIHILIVGEKREKESFLTKEGDLLIEGFTIIHEVALTDEFHNPNYAKRHVIIKDCNFENQCTIQSYFHITGLNIDGCHFKDMFHLVAIPEIDVEINTCVFNDNLFLNSTNNKRISISNIKAHGDINFSGDFKSQVWLSEIENKKINTEVKAELGFLKAMINFLSITELKGADISLTSCTLEGVMLNQIKAESLIIRNSQITSWIFLHSALLKKIDIFGSRKLASEIKELRIAEQCQIEQVIIDLESLDYTKISDSEFNYLFLTGRNNDTSVFEIGNATFKTLNFADLYNKGTIAINELTPKDSPGEIIINSSNLGRTEFIHCHFSNEKLRFNNSRITEIFISDSDFPKLVYKDNKNEPDPIQAKLAFGQLHTALSNQGDTVRALEYQSREIAAHYQTLRWFSLRRPWFNFTKFNLWLNWISNDFGRDWVRGIFFTFGVGLLFFVLLLISTDRYQFGIPTIDWDLLPCFLKFMNPLRFFDFDLLFKSDAKFSTMQFIPGSYLWDFLGRIFLAYGFYQTIQAFRRYGRK